ncbi:MAG: ribulose-phosphate 3-epimerase [bacterium]
MRKIHIAPSILSADFRNLEETFVELKKAGCDYVHLDVMDGRFVPNITFGQAVVAALDRFAVLPLDVHLMIEEPGRYISEFAFPHVEYICVHAEACTHLDRVIEQIREAGKRPGVSLNPATPASALEYVLDGVDMVLVMSVNPGFGGQKFIPGALKKVETIRRWIDALGAPKLLGIDGGINERNAVEAVRAGADFLVTGSYLFGERGGPAAAVKKLRNAFKSIK